MRELAAKKLVALRLVKTADMEADMMTKILERAAFDKHRDSVMNVSALPRTYSSEA